MLPLPCMLVCAFLCANRTRDRGCSKLTGGRKLSSKPRAQCVARSRNYIHVIASEAKQSMSRHKERMDCFATLAMTVSKDIAMPQQKRRTFRPAAHAHVIAVRLRY